jgi:hypothetical protein
MVFSIRDFVMGWSAAVVLLMVFGAVSAEAQGTAEQPGYFSGVKAVLGLPGMAPNTQGTLIFAPGVVRFRGETAQVAIERRRIIGVSSGEERIETGGTGGRVARVLIPYGGGLALGAVTHKKVGLLTIEYLDRVGEYHGAVFLMPTEEIDRAVAQLEVRPPTVYVAPVVSPGGCAAGRVETNTVRVEMVGAEASARFPAEDRVLLYERLVEQLQGEKEIAEVLRAGGDVRRCAEFTVSVRAIAFDKGDQAVRASVGPLGHFVGTTKLRYEVKVTGADGRVLFDEERKGSDGSDSDSLNVTKGISKAVVKSVRRAEARMRKG